MHIKTVSSVRSHHPSLRESGFRWAAANQSRDSSVCRSLASAVGQRPRFTIGCARTIRELLLVGDEQAGAPSKATVRLLRHVGRNRNSDRV